MEEFFSDSVRVYGSKKNPIRRFRTNCCALGQLSLNNGHTIEEINLVLNIIKEETNIKWNPSTRAGGERAIFVITTMPMEKPLALKLEEIGFKCITGFNRRNGYPNGDNLMWIIKW